MRLKGPTGEEYRVVQLHPTLRCNLRCMHCYSTSGPEQKDALTLPQLQQALASLRGEGYNGVGISGGEPLLFKPLPELLRFARSLGMISTVTTNGMLLTPHLAEQLAEAADVVAISLDGTAASHNQLRAHPRAFEIMAEKVALLRAANISFGFIFTLTLYNLDELDWVARFAAEQGAALLQVHPLEEFGRAHEALPQSAPDDYELARAFVEVARLQSQYREQLTIQFDVADRELLSADPSRGFAVQLEPAADGADFAAIPLADLVAPLIVEADGAVSPIQYGFAEALRVGNIFAADWPVQLADWKRNKFLQFLALCRAVHGKIVAPDEDRYPFVNWYGEISAASRQQQSL